MEYKLLDEFGKIFNTKTKMDIIKTLISDPKKEWYGKEIADFINVTPASVYIQILDLIKLGLVAEEKRGRMRFFKINKDNEIVKLFLNKTF